MKIKNLLFQPVTLHLSIDNEGLHLNAREVKDVLEDRLSKEIQRAAERGLVSIIRGAGRRTNHASDANNAITTPSETTVPASDPAEAPNDTPITPKKGNRK